MLESDADRLELIQTVGGVRVRAPDGEFWAIFDSEFSVAATDVEVEDATPAILCRSSDAERFAGAKDVSLEVSGKSYRIRRIEPDGTGMTRLALRA